MTIIKKAGYPHLLESNGSPRNWMGEDWAEVHEDFEAEVWACLGYCDITLGDLVIELGKDEHGKPITETIPEGLVVGLVTHEPPAQPEPEPTAGQLLDILLGVEA